MADYVVNWTNLLSNTILGSLPAEAISYTDVVSAVGSAKITCPLQTAIARSYELGLAEQTFDTPGIDPNEFRPGKVGIFIKRDNVVVWSGLLATIDIDVAANTFDANCVSWLSFFNAQYIRSDLSSFDPSSFTFDDQTKFAAALIASGQSLTVTDKGSAGSVIGSNDLGIDPSGWVATGVTRPGLIFYGYERKNVGQELVNLAGLDDGFDFIFTAARDGAGYLITFRSLYPTTGRDSGIRFEMGSNVELLKATIDGTTLANWVETTGSGDTTNQLAAAGYNAASLAEYPIFQDELSQTDVTDPTVLEAYTDRRLSQGGQPTIIPTIDVNPDLDPVYGSYGVGDAVYLTGSYGLLSIADFFKVTTIAVTVDTTGKETVEVDLAPVAMFAPLGGD